jgi:hypothetical protein
MSGKGILGQAPNSKNLAEKYTLPIRSICPLHHMILSFLITLKLSSAFQISVDFDLSPGLVEHSLRDALLT